MFAFSIWDANAGQLFIARDRTGMKPLHYMPLRDGLVYCSELRSLLAVGGPSLQVLPSAVLNFLMLGYIQAPDSIFQGVRKLPPGHLLTWSAKRGVEIRSYWTPPPPDEDSRSEDDLVDELKQRLDSAVKSHLESEVPLGAFLSGGLDSSTVVALMSRHAAGRVKTFSIGFTEAEFDETENARTVANHFGTDHTALTVTPDVEAMFEAIATVFDEPFGDSSAIPTFLVSQLARQSVTVALSGDGGDELFGGYSRYGKALRQKRLPGPLAAMARTIGPNLPHRWPGRNRIIDLARSPHGRYAASIALPSRTDEGGIAAPDIPSSLNPLDHLLDELWSPELKEDYAAAIMRFDLQTYLPGDILTKVDRTSMAVSLEARVPLLDFDLVDFAQRLPSRLRVTPGQSKRLLRRAIKGLVPDSVLAGAKRGFAIPLAPWFRGPLRHRIESLRTPGPLIAPYLDTKAVQRQVQEHLSGRRNHSDSLWRLMVLNEWLAALRRGDLARPPHIPTISVA
jgi:asparagine synthase (glutamine-hydrolysing)